MVVAPVANYNYSASTLSADPTEGDWQAQLGDVSISQSLDLDQSPGTV
jgi:hypothetical protein